MAPTWPRVAMTTQPLSGLSNGSNNHFMNFSTLQLSRDWRGAPGVVAYWPQVLGVQTATSGCGTCAVEHVNNKWKQAHRCVVWLSTITVNQLLYHYVFERTYNAYLLYPALGELHHLLQSQQGNCHWPWSTRLPALLMVC